MKIPVVTEYFPMTDDEGGELSAGVRPAPLEERRPQSKLQRHAGIGYELVQALDAPVLQMVEQFPDVHHFFATCLPVVAEQVIDVPKIILENIPRDACVATRNWWNSWWKCRRSYPTLYCNGLWRSTSTSQFLVVVGVVHVSDALVSGRSLSVGQDRAPQRFMEQNIRNFRVFKVYSQDRVLLRFVEQNFKNFMVFKVYPQDRVLLRFVEQNFIIFPQDRSPQRFVEQNIILTESFPQDRAPQRFVEQNKKLLLIHAQDMAPQRWVEHSTAFSRDRAPQRLVEHSTAFFRDRAPQRLVEHIMDFSRDRAQQHFMEQNIMDFSWDRAQQHLVELNIFIIFLLLCLLMEGAVVLMARQNSGPCVSACSSVLARASRGTSPRLHMHGKSSILTLLSGACRRRIHRQPRAVYKYWATLRCGSCGRPCDHALSVPAFLADAVEGTSDSVHRQSVGQRSSWVGRLHARWCANDRALVRQRSCFLLTRWSTSLACGSCRCSGAGVEETVFSHSCSLLRNPSRFRTCS